MLSKLADGMCYEGAGLVAVLLECGDWRLWMNFDIWEPSRENPTLMQTHRLISVSGLMFNRSTCIVERFNFIASHCS